MPPQQQSSNFVAKFVGAFVLGGALLLFAMSYNLGGSKAEQNNILTLSAASSRIVGLNKRLQTCTDTQARAALNISTSRSIVNHLNTENEALVMDNTNLRDSNLDKERLLSTCREDNARDRQEKTGVADENIDDSILHTKVDNLRLEQMLHSVNETKKAKRETIRRLIRAYRIENQQLKEAKAKKAPHEAELDEATLAPLPPTTDQREPVELPEGPEDRELSPDEAEAAARHYVPPQQGPKFSEAKKTTTTKRKASAPVAPAEGGDDEGGDQQQQQQAPKRKVVKKRVVAQEEPVVEQQQQEQSDDADTRPKRKAAPPRVQQQQQQSDEGDAEQPVVQKRQVKRRVPQQQQQQQGGDDQQQQQQTEQEDTAVQPPPRPKQKRRAAVVTQRTEPEGDQDGEQQPAVARQVNKKKKKAAATEQVAEE